MIVKFHFSQTSLKELNFPWLLLTFPVLFTWKKLVFLARQLFHTSIFWGDLKNRFSFWINGRIDIEVQVACDGNFWLLPSSGNGDFWISSNHGRHLCLVTSYKDNGHILRKDLWVVFLSMCKMAAETNMKRCLFLPSLFLRTYHCQAGTWGGDLIVFVGPGVGNLIDIVLPGEEIFESFFSRRALGSIESLNTLRYHSNWKLYLKHRKLYQVEKVQRSLVFKRPLSRGR